MRDVVRRGALALALALSAAGLPAPAAAEFTEEEIKRLALEAILENPQIVLDAVAILRQREAEAAAAAQRELLSEQRMLLERDPNAPVVGNPEGSVTVVEFMDYNCPYCKRAAGEVAALLDGDGDIRVVYREWPILGEGSVYAARAALAARRQGKYPQMHERLMGLRGRVDEAAVLRVAREIGLDIEQLQADMQAPEIDEHLETSRWLAEQLGFSGTPSFVIGDALAPGFVELEQLQSMVAAARAAE